MNKIVETLKKALKTKNCKKIDQIKKQILGYNSCEHYPFTVETQIDYALECAYQCGVNDERSRKQTSVQAPKESTMVVIIQNLVTDKVYRYRVTKSQMDLLEELFDELLIKETTVYYLEEDMPEIIDLT